MSEPSFEGMQDQEISREWVPYVSDSEWEYLLKMDAIIGRRAVEEIIHQGEVAVRTRLAAFEKYETALLRHVEARLPTPAPSPPIQVIHSPAAPAAPQVRPLKVAVKPFLGKQGENLAFWFREVDIALRAALVTSELQKVAFALSHLQGAARDWALTWETNHPGYFSSWASMQASMSTMFIPPNAIARHRADFLACRQAKLSLYDFVQELRRLRAAMATNPLAEDVMVTVFMEGLNNGPPKTEVFRAQPTELEPAIYIALREDHLQRQAQGLRTSPLERAPTGNDPEPMDVSAIEQKAQVNCYGCGRFGHFQRDCPRGRTVRFDTRRDRRGDVSPVRRTTAAQHKTSPRRMGNVPAQ
jgi:Retrotransposon gag protein/Zinc knuckle